MTVAVVPFRRRGWLDSRALAMAASLGVLGFAVGAGLTSLRTPAGSPDVAQHLVSDFARAEIAGQPFDVASSDRHTVKPWLAGKIAGATTVVDLKGDGFPLVGGRIDVVGGTPVPTLVYQRREHQLALSEMPGSSANSSTAPRPSTRGGYNLVEWEEGGRFYAAVSDLPPAELDAFAAAFRRAAAAEREEAPKP